MTTCETRSSSPRARIEALIELQLKRALIERVLAEYMTLGQREQRLLAQRRYALR